MPSIPSSPPRGLTAKFIESLAVPEVAYELGDAACPGLRLRVLPSGLKVFRYYIRALNRVVTFGPWAMTETVGHLTILQARTWLGRVKEARRGGVDQLDRLLRELRAQLEPVRAKPPLHESSAPVAQDLDEYYSLVVVPNRKKSHRWVRYLFARFIAALESPAVLGKGALMSAVDKAVVRKVIEKIMESRRALAGAILDNIRPFFAWAADTGRIAINPAERLTRKTFRLKRSRRKRSLKPVELPMFWATVRSAATGKRRRTCLALQFILLTGVRVGQLVRARWESVSLADATWTIPSDHRKRTHPDSNDDDFVVPLSPLALKVLQELRALAGDSAWVLPGKTPGAHVTPEALRGMIHKLFGSRTKGALVALEGGPVTIHDLRRTMRTQLGRLRVPYDIAERCLDHSLGDMDETYNQGDHIDERREAVTRLAQYLEELEAVPLPSSELHAEQ